MVNLILLYLTQFGLDISVTTAVWICDTFENKLGINYKFTNYLNESKYWFGSDLHFGFKYLLKSILWQQIYHQIGQDSLGSNGHQ